MSERQVSERLLGGCEGERGLVPLQRRLLSEYHVLTRAVLAGHFDVSEHRGEAEAVLSRKKLESGLIQSRKLVAACGAYFTGRVNFFNDANLRTRCGRHS